MTRVPRSADALRLDPPSRCWLMNGTRTDPAAARLQRGPSPTPSPVREHRELRGADAQRRSAAFSSPAAWSFSRAPDHAIHHHAQDERALGGGRDSPTRNLLRASGGLLGALADDGVAVRRLKVFAPARKACASASPEAERTIMPGPFDRGRRVAGRLQHPARCVHSTMRSSGRRVRQQSSGTARSTSVL